MLKDVTHNDDEDYFKKLELDVLARTIFGEARGCDTDIKEAITNIVMNRVRVSEARGKYWWGNNIIQVCQKPYQFPCWDRSSELYKDLLNVTAEDLEFLFCMTTALGGIEGTLQDNTERSTHYHHESNAPFWSRTEHPEVIINDFKFYKLVEV